MLLNILKHFQVHFKISIVTPVVSDSEVSCKFRVKNIAVLNTKTIQMNKFKKISLNAKPVNDRTVFSQCFAVYKFSLVWCIIFKDHTKYIF